MISEVILKLDKVKEVDLFREEKKEESKAIRVPRFDAQAHLLTLGVPSDLSADWIKLRKTKKAEVTKTAIEGIYAEAEKAGMTLEAALRECCSSGWAGFKASWLDRDRLPQARGSPLPTTGRQSRIDNYAAQAAAARGGNENEYGTGRTERDITSEAVRVA